MSNHPCTVLLLNPPSPRPVFRDAYCSGPSKAPMLVHPLDLQVQSGFLNQPPFRLAFIDAIFSSLTEEQTLAEVEAMRPDVVLALVGSYSLANDAAFFARLKARLPGVRLFLTGDLARFDPAPLWLAVPGAEGLLPDFASPALRDHLCGTTGPESLLLRAPVASGVPAAVSSSSQLEVPIPWAGLPRKYPYQLPFFSDPRFYSILSSYGCPFTCRYCNAHLVGYRERDPAAFVDELKVAKAMGFRSLYIRDATFMVNRRRTLELFRAWSEAGLDFEWMCFTRPDLLDDELVGWAARLGCRVMMIGVESSDGAWLRDMKRKTVLPEIRETFGRLRRAGIRTAAQMMVGMDDATGFAGAAYEQQLLEFLKDLDPDFVSLNVFTRRPGLQVEHPSLSQVEARRGDYQDLAARVNRAFYFRPITVARQLRQFRLRQVPLLARVAYQLARG